MSDYDDYNDGLQDPDLPEGVKGIRVVVTPPMEQRTESLGANTEVITAIVKARQAFTAVLKDKANPAFKSKYADLGAVFDATYPGLHENGLVLMQQTKIERLQVWKGGLTAEMLPIYEIEEHTWLFSRMLHVSGEWLGLWYEIKPMQDTPQGWGSALTYARRYSAQVLLGVAPEDDDGNAASQRSGPEPSGKDWKFEIQQADTREALLELYRLAQHHGELTAAVRTAFTERGEEFKKAREAKEAQDAAAEGSQDSAPDSGTESVPDSGTDRPDTESVSPPQEMSTEQAVADADALVAEAEKSKSKRGGRRGSTPDPDSAGYDPMGADGGDK